MLKTLFFRRRGFGLFLDQQLDFFQFDEGLAQHIAQRFGFARKRLFFGEHQFALRKRGLRERADAVGGALTLGLYGILKGRSGVHSMAEWTRSFVPMGMMAAGDLSVIVASRLGPISVVSPISGAYPLVTLIFAWIILKEKITTLQWLNVALILLGMFMSPNFSAEG